MTSTRDRLRISQRVRLPRTEVFRAFSDRRLARKWAPDGCRIVAFKADMRVGGAFRQVMQCGRDRHVAHGIYRKIVPGRSVAFTHQWEEPDPVETLVTVAFRAAKGATEIVLTQRGFREAAEAAGHAAGWSQALARFAKLVESRRKPAPGATRRAG